MTDVLYHLHIDAARMPESLLAWATTEGGFHADDFPHSFHINGEEMNARHLTKYIYDPNPIEVKAFCQQIKNKAAEANLLGFVQAEFIMDEIEWTGVASELAPLTPPFQIKMRPLDPMKGESFKKHEIHVEFEKDFTSKSIISALLDSGFHVLESEKYITFTCSGHPKELTTIFNKLCAFLAPHTDAIRGKIVHEATAFWSMHGMESEHLPSIVESVH
jgi:hypothetical protein